MGAGTRIIGDLTIGDGVFIGMDCIVTQDVPPNTKVTAVQELRFD